MDLDTCVKAQGVWDWDSGGRGGQSRAGVGMKSAYTALRSSGGRRRKGKGVVDGI